MVFCRVSITFFFLELGLLISVSLSLLLHTKAGGVTWKACAQKPEGDVFFFSSTRFQHLLSFVLGLLDIPQLLLFHQN